MERKGKNKRWREKGRNERRREREGIRGGEKEKKEKRMSKEKE